MSEQLSVAQQKLLKHRNAAMRKGESASEYAQRIGVPFQRLGRLLRPGAKAPSLHDACAIAAVTKIKPSLWLDT